MGRWLYAALSVIVLYSLVAALVTRRTRQPRRALRALVGGLVSLNGLTVLACLVLALISLTNPSRAWAQGTTPAPAADLGSVALGAALATGLACIGAGIGVGIAGAAAIGSITEKPEILGRTLIFVGLAEGIAIYGLIISFMILNR